VHFGGAQQSVALLLGAEEVKAAAATAAPKRAAKPSQENASGAKAPNAPVATPLSAQLAAVPPSAAPTQKASKLVSKAAKGASAKKPKKVAAPA
jgi:hypothetical protein